ncbi:MAG TPA: ABC transporter permease [Chloroflexota bacterium]|nr:ABC transporter permease [Chloroflexota bacterium]
MYESLQELWNGARRNPVTLIGFVLLLALVLIAIFAPLLAPYSPNYTDASNALQGPTRRHLFGTGVFGEDIFSRVLFGARYDLGIALGAVGIGFTCGSAIGAIAGYIGGITDEVLMRFMDMVEAFPSFILAMAVAGALGPSLPNLIAAIAVTNVPIYARLMRSRLLTIRGSQYALAAVGVGNTRARVLYAHLLPNSFTPIFVQSTLQSGYAILDAAGLSFIGLGIRLPTPEWGVMISLGVSRIISGQWWASFFPGLAIVVTVMAFNLIGDSLQDLLDPQRR